MTSDLVNFDKFQDGSMEVEWIHGSVSSKYNTDPDIQIHYYNEHTIILRQNMAVHHEAPFLFLLFGNIKCILFDTGATKSPAHFPLRATIDELIQKWLKKHPRNQYKLIVAHTHLHRDHLEGDAQFEDRPYTIHVGKSLQETKEFYGFLNWPRDDDIEYDLGGRKLNIIATPGHEDAEITVYDAYTRLMLTGDIVLPGRLYVNVWSDFKDSIERMIAFCAQHPVKYLLGCHVEMGKFPGQDYLIRQTYQPYERVLQMTVEHLKKVGKAVKEIDGKPGQYFYDDFIVYNGIPDRYFEFAAWHPDAEPGDCCVGCIQARK
jgi:glyoxylase-like metal-dependent hydrolase (beta-lactamase superfamily II)